VKPATRQHVAAAAALAFGIAGVVAGLHRTHRVYDPEAAEFGILAVKRISERQLLVDATFTGVVRRNGRLVSTYDRTQPRGKRPCPT
jgi:hypothetical protein